MASDLSDQPYDISSQLMKKIIVVSDEEAYIECLSELDRMGYFDVQILSLETELDVVSMLDVKPSLIIFDIQWLQKHTGKPLLYFSYQHRIPSVIATDSFENPFLQILRQSGTFNCIHKCTSIAQLLLHLEWTITFESLLRQTEMQAGQLQNALKQERDINVAIGIKMVEWGVSRKESFERLRKQARDTRQKMSKICKEYLDAFEMNFDPKKNNAQSKRIKVEES